MAGISSSRFSFSSWISCKIQRICKICILVALSRINQSSGPRFSSAQSRLATMWSQSYARSSSALLPVRLADTTPFSVERNTALGAPPANVVLPTPLLPWIRILIVSSKSCSDSDLTVILGRLACSARGASRLPLPPLRPAGAPRLRAPRLAVVGTFPPASVVVFLVNRERCGHRAVVGAQVSVQRDQDQVKYADL